MRGRFQTFTLKEINHIIHTSEEPYKTIYTILASTGKRVTEVLQLRGVDLDFERQRITWSLLKRSRPIKVTKSYNNKKLFTQLKKYVLEARVNEQDFLFPGRFERRHLTRFAVDKNLKRNFSKNYHAHMFRHSYGTRLAEKNRPLQDIMKALDHVKPDTTLHYINLSSAYEQALRDEAMEGIEF